MVREVVPTELIPELVRLRWKEHQTYTQIAERYPYYSRSALAMTIQRASHRSYYQTICAWCEQRFRTVRANKRFCQKSCALQHWRFHHWLGSSLRPPAELRKRICAGCGQPLPEGKYANARYCSHHCGARDYMRQYRAERKGSTA